MRRRKIQKSARCRPSVISYLAFILLWGLFCFLFLFSNSVIAAERAGIIVSVPGLDSEPVPNALSDGRMIAIALQELNFSTLLIENPNARDLGQIPSEVQKYASDARLVILYVVGPALSVRNENILLAHDSTYKNETQLRESSLRLNELVDQLSQDERRSVVVVLDTSGVPPTILRANPSLAGITSFAKERANLLVALPNMPGAVTSRVESGENGVYATAMANALRRVNEGLFSTFKNIRRNVREATGGVLLPTLDGGLRSNEVLRAPLPPEADIDDQKPRLDQILWSFVRDSADETDFEDFAQLFPTSAYRERALGRQIRLASASQPGVGNLVRSFAAPTDTPSDNTSQESFSATTGDRAPPLPLRIWPRELPITPNGLSTWVTKCDELAADPDDPMRLTVGVRWDLVNQRAAVRACIAALTREPNNRRIQFQLGRVLDIADYYNWAQFFYSQAIERSYSAAVANLAYMYMTGRGREIDLQEAIRLLRIGADLGNLRTRTDLAESYLRGAGVPQSTEEAILWLRLAGAMGWPNAIDILGNLYFQGRGVEKNLAWGVELFATSAAVGNTNAMVNLGRAYLYGQGVGRDLKTGREWLERSMAGGNPFAPFFLGELYANGEGVPKDTKRAIMLYDLSAQRGFGQARFELGKLYERGVSKKPDLVTAAFHYTLANRQTYETPVSPEITQSANERLAEIMKQLSPTARKQLEGQVNSWLELNGN